MAGAGLLEQALGLATGLERGQEQVLGGDVLVAESAGLVLGLLDERARTRGSRPSWPPSILARRESTAGDLHRDRGRVDAELAQGHHGDALGVVEQRSEQVLDVEHGGLWRREASCCAARMASWAFWVYRSSFMAGARPCRSAGSGSRARAADRTVRCGR